MRAPRMTIPPSVSLRIFAVRSLSCFSTGRERSTCGLTKVWGHADVVVADMGVIGAKILGETPVPMAEFISRRGEGGDEYIHEIRAAAEHSAGRIHPDLDHLPPADQVVDRARLDE